MSKAVIREDSKVVRFEANVVGFADVGKTHDFRRNFGHEVFGVHDADRRITLALCQTIVVFGPDIVACSRAGKVAAVKRDFSVVGDLEGEKFGQGGAKTVSCDVELFDSKSFDVSEKFFLHGLVDFPKSIFNKCLVRKGVLRVGFQRNEFRFCNFQIVDPLGDSFRSPEGKDIAARLCIHCEDETKEYFLIQPLVKRVLT